MPSLSQNTNDSSISRTRSGRTYHFNNQEPDDTSTVHVATSNLFGAKTIVNGSIPEEEPLSSSDDDVDLIPKTQPTKNPTKKRSSDVMIKFNNKKHTEHNMKYTPEKRDYLLMLIERMLPIGQKDSEKLAEKHNKRFTHGRVYSNLRKTFKDMSEMKGKTGCTECPRYILKARSIQEKITKKCQIIVHSEDAPPDVDDQNEQDDLTIDNATEVVADIAEMNQKKNKPKRNKTLTRSETSNQFFEYIIHQDKQHQESQLEARRREKLREKLERKREKKKENRFQQMMKLKQKKDKERQKAKEKREAEAMRRQERLEIERMERMEANQNRQTALMMLMLNRDGKIDTSQLNAILQHSASLRAAPVVSVPEAPFTNLLPAMMPEILDTALNRDGNTSSSDFEMNESSSSAFSDDDSIDASVSTNASNKKKKAKKKKSD